MYKKQMSEFVGDGFNSLFPLQDIQKPDGGSGTADASQDGHGLPYAAWDPSILHDLYSKIPYVRTGFMKKLSQFPGSQRANIKRYSCLQDL
jgi:hypothetical protein